MTDVEGPGQPPVVPEGVPLAQAAVRFDRSAGWTAASRTSERDLPSRSSVGVDNADAAARAGAGCRQDTEPAPFVGRARELEVLGRFLADAVGGHTGLLVVAGPAGIGKTALVDRLVRTLPETDIRVLRVACQPAASLSYWPWARVLRAWMAGRDAHGLAATLGPTGGELAEIMPGLAGSIPLGDPAGEQNASSRFRLFDAVSGLLGRSSLLEPLLVVFDDIQWMDADSLSLLRFVARDLADARVLLIAVVRTSTGRPGLLPAGVADLAELPRSAVLQLVGLQEDEVADLLAVTVGAERAVRLAPRVHAQTEGFPLFVRETARALTAACRAAQWTSASLPAGLLGLPSLARRTEAMTEPTRQLVELAAVIGQQVSVPLIADAMRYTPREVHERLDEAVQADVLVGLGDGEYRFTHALIAEAIYEQLGLSRRQDLHELVACALVASSAHGSAAAIAHHYRRAGPDATANAVDYSERAGEEAMHRLAFEDAALHYQQVLELLPALGPCPTRELAGRLALARTMQRAGRPEDALHAFRQAADLATATGDQEHLADAALGYEDTLLAAGRPRLRHGDPSTALLHAALDARGLPASTRARLSAGLARAQFYTDGAAGAAGPGQQALRLARAADDPGALAYALDAWRIIRSGPEDLDGRLALARELVATAHAAGDLHLALEAQQALVLVVLERADVTALDVEIEAYARLAEAVRDPAYRYFTPTLRAMRAIQQGRYEEAARFIERARALGQRADSDNARQFVLMQTYALGHLTGKCIDGEQDFRRYLGETGSGPTWRCTIVHLLAASGQRRAAARELEILAEDEYAAIPSDGLWLFAMSLLGEACALIRASHHASALHRVLAPHGDAVVPNVAPLTGAVADTLGLLAGAFGDHGQAVEHLRTALSIHVGMRASAWTARTHLRLAEALTASGASREEQLWHLDRSCALANELGMSWVKTAASPLRSANASAPPGSQDPLTPREHDVLRLLAAGLANKQIARRLGMSDKTVKTHVGHILRKLGVGDRTSAALYAVQHHLVSTDPGGVRPME